jgi:GTPase SAR1 family protein
MATDPVLEDLLAKSRNKPEKTPAQKSLRAMFANMAKNPSRTDSSVNVTITQPTPRPHTSMTSLKVVVLGSSRIGKTSLIHQVSYQIQRYDLVYMLTD